MILSVLKNTQDKPTGNKILKVTAATCLSLLLVSCSTSPTNSDDSNPSEEPGTPTNSRVETYSSKAAYPFDGKTDYSAVPEGYEPASLQHLGRHGSRLLSSKKYDDLLDQLLTQAQTDGEITDQGEQLLTDIKEMTAIHEKVGYGNLSELGRIEQRQIGERAYNRLEPLFTADSVNGDIIFKSSGRERATESGENFILALAEKAGFDAVTLQNQRIDDTELLYFHKSDEEYLDYKDNDPDLNAAIDALHENPEISSAAQDIMKRYVSEAFLERLNNGEFDFVDNGKGKKHLTSAVDAALDLYQLYVISPLISEETDLNFDQYLTEKEAKIFGFLADAENFYAKGPAFEGRDITYGMSKVLLEDFLAELQKVQDDADYSVSTTRFAHAETTIPFSVLLQLPGSTTPVTVDKPYSHETNPWRGAIHTPMATNIQWDIYRNSDNPSNVIVRMLYNEKETPFVDTCIPIADGSVFYDAAELQSCLSALL